MKIHKTSEYSQFEFTFDNRPLDTGTVKYRNLLGSMERYGFLPSFPITVKRSGARYKIIDGQNRFDAAKRLGIPVLFVVYEGVDDIDIAALNGTQRAWSMSDYVGSHANKGNANYHFLQEFAKRNKLQFLRAASLLYGEMAASGNVSDKLKNGTFEIRDVEYAERVMSLVNALSEHCAWARSTGCVAALSRLVRVKEFDDGALLKRIPSNLSILANQPTIEAFTKMFESVYNSRSRNPVPITFLAEQAMKARACGGRMFKNERAA